MNDKQKHRKSMQTYFIIWFGQMVSLVGTGMSRFALMIWAFQQTEQATTLALLGFFSLAPHVLTIPLAGVWVDRLDRRIIMIVADMIVGIMTIIILALLYIGNLAIWHLFLMGALIGIVEAFQITAYYASMSMLVTKDQLSRANGMQSFAYYASQILAPFFAGFLLAIIHLEGILWIDIATFLFSVFTLLFVRIPRPTKSIDSPDISERIWRQVRFGFKYIFQRKGLLGLLSIFTGINFFAGLTYFAIMPAMILARTGGDEQALALVQGALGIGGVIGGLVLSIWGGPKRLIHGVLAGAGISFLLGDFLFAVGQRVEVWVVAGLLAAFFIPFIVGSDRSIWQKKVSPDIQGRVFSVKAGLQEGSLPIAYLIAGPLADKVFEPAMMADGWLSPMFGDLVGTGAGAGMGLMFMCTAFLGLVMSLSGYLFSEIRNVEENLPDYDNVEIGQMPIQPTATLEPS